MTCALLVASVFRVKVDVRLYPEKRKQWHKKHLGGNGLKGLRVATGCFLSWRKGSLEPRRLSF